MLLPYQRRHNRSRNRTSQLPPASHPGTMWTTCAFWEVVHPCSICSGKAEIFWPGWTCGGVCAGRACPTSGTAASPVVSSRCPERDLRGAAELYGSWHPVRTDQILPGDRSDSRTASPPGCTPPARSGVYLRLGPGMIPSACVAPSGTCGGSPKSVCTSRVVRRNGSEICYTYYFSCYEFNCEY